MDIVVRMMVGVAGAFIVGLGAYKERKVNEEIERVKKVAREVREHLRRPPCILIVGLPHHGKSSFINSVFRVLCSERKALIRRAETGPCPLGNRHRHSHSHSPFDPNEDKEKALKEEEDHSHLGVKEEENKDFKEEDKMEEEMGMEIEEESIDERPLCCTTLRFKSHHVMDQPHHKIPLFSLLDSPPLHPLWLLPSSSTHHPPTMAPSSNPSFFLRQAQMADEIQQFIESARIYTTTEHDELPLAHPDCTIIVVSAAAMASSGMELIRSLQMLTQAIRNQDLPFIIVFTFKSNVHPNEMKQMMEDVCLSCATESIYCIDNYVESPLPNIIGKECNGYDIRSTIVDILRQSLEFCR